MVLVCGPVMCHLCLKVSIILSALQANKGCSPVGTHLWLFSGENTSLCSDHLICNSLHLTVACFFFFFNSSVAYFFILSLCAVQLAPPSLRLRIEMRKSERKQVLQLQSLTSVRKRKLSGALDEGLVFLPLPVWSWSAD